MLLFMCGVFGLCTQTMAPSLLIYVSYLVRYICSFLSRQRSIKRIIYILRKGMNCYGVFMRRGGVV